MKRLLLSLLVLFTASNQITFAAGGWTPVSAQEAEREIILANILTIRKHYIALEMQVKEGSSGRSSYVINTVKRLQKECPEQIFKYLKSIGSPVAYEILEEMCACGELPASFLAMA